MNSEEARMTYTMMQTCKETDMTYQALKYYCNEGLVPNVKRDDNNRRIFDERDVKWIKEDLCLQGPSTIPERKVMLAEKKKALQAQIAELNEYVDYIDWKQNFYDEVQSGKRPYISNLIQVEES